VKDLPFLDRPLVPLAVRLPRMLARVEAEIVGKKLGAAEERRLRRRAESIRRLLSPSPSAGDDERVTRDTSATPGMPPESDPTQLPDGSLNAHRTPL
jgi:hypothetical protein